MIRQHAMIPAAQTFHTFDDDTIGADRQFRTQRNLREVCGIDDFRPRAVWLIVVLPQGLQADMISPQLRADFIHHRPTNYRRKL